MFAQFTHILHLNLVQVFSSLQIAKFNEKIYSMEISFALFHTIDASIILWRDEEKRGDTPITIDIEQKIWLTNLDVCIKIVSCILSRSFGFIL